MELNKEEQEIIQAHRRKANVNRRTHESGDLIARITHEWVEYSRETGSGLTYSEFCDGFYYDGRVAEEYQANRKTVYEAVKAVIKVIDPFAVDMANKILAEIKA